MWASVSVFWGDCVLIFGSASTLREQFNDEKTALQQSIGKNSALIAEKEQLVQTLRSEVGIKHTLAQSLIQRFHFLRRKCVFFSQLAELRSEDASVRSLQGAVEALEQDKKYLEERTQSLEKELAGANNTINLPSGKN